MNADVNDAVLTVNTPPSALDSAQLTPSDAQMAGKVPDVSASAGVDLALWALGGCVFTLLNRFIGRFVALPDYSSVPGHLLALIYLAGLLFCLMQMTRSAARLPLSIPSFVILGLAFGAPMGAVLLAQKGQFDPPIWLYLTANNLFLPIGAALLGAGVGRIVKHPNTLLAAAGFAIFFDMVVVGLGTVSQLMKSNPGIIQAVSVGAGASAPASAKFSWSVLVGVTIGPADILFLALFFSSILLLKLSWRETFAWMFGLLLTALLIVEFNLLPASFPGIPALVPMGSAVLIANLKHQRFTQQEKRDLIIGAAFAVFCACAIIFGSRALVKPAPPSLGVTIGQLQTNKLYVVMAVKPGSRAEAAGLRGGDVVLAVNGNPMEKIKPEEYDAMLSGAGTKGITFSIKSGDHPKPRDIVFAPLGSPATAPSPAAPSKK